jgi:hypothetical protein
VEKSVAYRFVPCDANGNLRENSQLTTITTELLSVGSKIEAAILGYQRWEVVEVRDATSPLVAARDSFGRDIALAGTVVCRGVA